MKTTFGEQVAKDRARLGLTQSELVKRLNDLRQGQKPLLRQWLVSLEGNTLKREIGLPMRKALAKALDADETLYQQLQLHPGKDTASHQVASVGAQFEINRVLSRSSKPEIQMNVNVVGSPKGGVGRTLFLIHAALIQARGCGWAGIPRTFPLMLDFDFSAPGVHTYPLRDAGSWNADSGESEYWTYRILGEDNVPQSGIDLHLKNKPVGLVFLLNNLKGCSSFQECSDLLVQGGGEEPNYEPAVAKMADFLVQQAELTTSSVNPLRHVISIVDANGQPRLAFFPAGSSRNLGYHTTVHELRWAELMANGMGQVLINALLKAVERIAVQASANQLLRKIDEVWIDQSPGQSIATEAHRQLASRTVLVSNLAGQSSDALLAWVESLESSERSNTWINLTFYRGRHLHMATDNKSGDILTYAVIDHTYERERFKKADEERFSVVENLAKLGVADEKISISDCEPELINSQGLRGPESEYFDSVVRLLLSMSAASNTHQPPALGPAGESLQITILGEYVGNPEDKEEPTPSGMLRALYEWLRLKYPSAIISGLALEHKEIARLASGEQLDVWTEDNRSPSGEPGLLRGVCAEKQPSSKSYKRRVSLAQFDIVALPSYTIDDAINKALLDSMGVQSIAELGVITRDRIGPVSAEYLNKTIRSWGEMAFGDDTTKIYGVPAFSHYPLIVSRSRSFQSPDFKDAFRERADRDFASFLSFADIRNAAIVGSPDGLASCGLIMATESVARVYEWLLVLGTLGYKPFPSNGIAVQDLPACLSGEDVFKATLNYALLNSLSPEPDPNAAPRGWNENAAYIEDKKAGFMFVWPDALYGEYQNKDTKKFAYAAVPARFQLRETWVLTVPNGSASDVKKRLIWQTLIDLMTPESQAVFTERGGIPVHSFVADNPSIWRMSPFARMLGIVRRGGHQQETISVPRRAFNGARLEQLGKILGDFCKVFKDEASKDSDDGFDPLNALRLAQDSRHPARIGLKKYWQDQVQKLNQIQAKS